MHKTILYFIFVIFFTTQVHALSHPLDDLSVAEVAEAIKIVRDSGRFPEGSRFPVVKRSEPKKQDLLSGAAREQRLAYVAAVAVREGKSMLTELVIDLKGGKLVSSKDLPGIQPPVLLEEFERARVLAAQDPRWLAAMKKRGFENMTDLFLDTWAPGLLKGDEKLPGQRLLRVLTYKKAKNVYSRPVEGVVVTVDLAKNKVVSVIDVETTKVGEGSKEFGQSHQTEVDPPMNPIETAMPAGPTYKIEGQEIQWGRWKFRYSMDPLQGLQLMQIRFVDGDKDRMVIYKLSLAEMLVPYAMPQRSWSFRNAFDVGEYGIGKLLHPLVAGQDVPSYATLLDVVVPDDAGGTPPVIKGIGLYERDAGILWKHRNSETGDADIRKARQLVMTFMTTIGNYDYGIDYIFNLDGSIKVDAKLTGILLAKGTDLEVNPCKEGCFPLVEKNILAPSHQHFFSFRIDFDIDGAQGNYAAETNVGPIPQGPKNPDGNAFEMSSKILATEGQGVRDHNPQSARKWKVFNPFSMNSLKHPRGYTIIPGETATPYLQPKNQIRQRAKFIEHPMWFTVYKDDETSGAALYPTTAPKGQGLPAYIANNESLSGQDIVMWYTFGVTHVPHPEQWPIMNVHHTGFTLMPVNFFSENPGMRIPESK